MKKSSRLFRSVFHELGRLRDFVAGAGKTPSSKRPSRLNLESLEDRAVPAAVITATKTYTFTDSITANGGLGTVNPTETVHYTVTVGNTGDATATGVVFDDSFDPNAPFVDGSLKVSPKALAKGFAAAGNTQVVVGAASGLKTGAVDIDNVTPFANLVLTTGTFTTTAGGSIVVAADGSFTYTPQTGDENLVDTFVYTITDGDGLAGTARVSFNLGEVVWYVDSTYAGANGTEDGSSSRPYNSVSDLSGASGSDQTGDIIFVRERTGDYDGNLTLLNNQRLFGGGVSLTVNGITIHDGTGGNTTLTTTAATTNAITLASDNTVRGFTIGNTTGAKIAGTSFGTATINTVTLQGSGAALNLTTGTLAATIDSLTSTSSTNAVSLTGVAGTLAINGGAISGATGAAFLVSGGTLGITSSGNITQGNNAALFSVAGGHTTGTLAFSGNLNASNGTGLQFDNADGTYNFTGTNALSGGDAGIDILNGSTGTFSFGTGTSITNPTGIAFNLAGATASNANVTYSGSISKNNAGRIIDIDNHDAGTITFQTGAISASGTSAGIRVQNSGGGTINFTGQTALSTTSNAAVELASNGGATINFNAAGNGLDITTTGGAGFTATGGGTVTVQGSGNTISSGTGTALNIANTTIGAADVIFQSISKDGTGTGIVLNNTGALGSLTVTGDAGSANNNSGGTIQNATVGISLTDTRDVVLDQMNIHHTTQNGIDGFHVTNFSLTNSKVETTGTASIAGDFEVSAIAFVDRSGANDNTIDGVVTITGNIITDPERNAIMIESWAGTISNLNISNNTLDGDGAGTTNGRIQDAVHVFAQGTTGGITTGTISNNTISDFRFFDTAPAIDIFIGGNGIRLVTDTNAVNPASTLGTTPNPFVISDNDIDNVGSNMIAVTAVGRTASANVRILNNGTPADPMTNAEGLGISVFFGGNGTFNGLVHNNVIDNIDQGANPSGSSGIGVQSDFGGNTGANTDVTNSNFTISNNIISDMAGNGIIATGINNAGTMNVRLIDNDVLTIPDLAARFGIRVGHSNVGTQPTINLEIHGNDTAGGNPIIGPPDGIGIRQQTGFTFGIEGLSPSPATGAQAKTYIESQNSGETVTILAGNNFINVNVPDGPSPLLAAPGGVEAVPSSPGSPPESSGTDTPPQDTGTSEPSAGDADATPPIVPPPLAPTTSIVDDGVLTQAEIDSLVGAAIDRWSATGLSAEQLAILQSITVTIADMPGWYLGAASHGHIQIDSDAAGNGWFIDSTPLDDVEFGNGVSATRLYTDPASAPAGKLDLLTTVMHELGHQLGLDDSYSLGDRDSLMYGYLHLGERRLPALGQAEGAVPHDHDHPEFLWSPVNIGDLEAGSTVTMKFDVLVADPFPNGVTQISNQGTVTFNGTQTKLTDDPAVGGANDPTNTPIFVPNTPPDITIAGGTLSYTENAAPVAIDPAATVVDVEQNWNTGTLRAQITAGASAADRLQILAVGGVTFSGLDVLVGGVTKGTASALSVTNNGTITVTFNASATDADVQAVARAIAFDNTSDAPSTGAPRNVTITVTDRQGASDNGARGLGVSEVNDPATAGDDALASIAEDSGDRTITFATVLANDSPGPGGEGGQTLTVTGFSNVVGGTVQIVGSSFVFSPIANYNGPAGFDYTVQDNGTTAGVSAPSSATARVSFTITEVNDAPTAGNDPLSAIAEDSGVRSIPLATLLSNDTTGPANESTQTLSILGLGNVVGGIIGFNGANVDFFPTPNFNGVAGFDYVVDDNGTTNGVFDPRSATARVSFTITEVNDAPVAGDDPLSSVAEDSVQRTIPFATLLGNDNAGPNEAGQTLNITGFSNVVGGTVSISGTDFLFTPDADFNGTASFDYTIQDDGTTNGSPDPLTDTGHVSFTVTEVNDATTATDDALSSIAEDSGTRTIPFTALTDNDSRGPANESGQTLTITNVTNAVGGTVSISGTDVLFTPNPDFNGAASFDYTVSDNGTTNGVADPKTDIGHVTFTVTDVNDAPVAANDSLSAVVEDSAARSIAFAELTGNDSHGPADESGQALTVASVGNAVGGTVNIVGGNVIFTPAADFFGVASFEYFVQDNGATNGTADPRTSVAPGIVSFTVTPVADTPSVTNATTTVNTQTTSGLVITPNAADGASVTHYQITGITNGTLFLNDGTTPVSEGVFITAAQGLAGLKFTPAANLANPATSFFFDVQAATGNTSNDFGGALVRATITVTDNIAPDTTIDTFPPALTNSNSASFTFSGTDNIVPPVLTFEYSLNGSAFTSTAISLGLTGQEGSNILLVHAIDEAGNPDPTPATYTWVVDTIAPDVTIGAPSASITNNGPVSFIVTYTDVNFDHATLSPADVQVIRAVSADAATVTVTPIDATHYTVTLSGITGDGALGIALPAGTAVDLAGNLARPAFQSTLFIVDNTKPTVTISAPSVSIARTGDSVTYTVTYADANFDAATLTDANVSVVTVTGTATASTVTVTPVDATTFTVTLSGLSGDGTVAIALVGNTAVDLAGNTADAAGPGAAFTVDNTKPTVTIGAPSVSTTPGGPVSFTVTVADANPGSITLTAAQVTFIGSTPTLTGTVTVTGTGNTRTITISDIRGGKGTFQISLPAGVATDAAGNVSDAPPTSAMVTVTGSRKLNVNVVPPPLRIAAGSTVIYRINYANTGTQSAAGAYLRVKLPVYARINRSMSAPGWQSIGNGWFQLNLGTLAPGARGAVRFSVIFHPATPPGTTAVFQARIFDALSNGAVLKISRAVTTVGFGRWQ